MNRGGGGGGGAEFIPYVYVGERIQPMLNRSLCTVAVLSSGTVKVFHWRLLSLSWGGYLIKVIGGSWDVDIKVGLME